MKLIRSSLSSLIYEGGRALGVASKGIRILCYHSVQENAKGYLSVLPEAFERQMAHLAEEGYRTLRLVEMKDSSPVILSPTKWDEGSSATQLGGSATNFGGRSFASLRMTDKDAQEDRRVVITFDDGYADNFQNAFPTMKKYGFFGTVFCIVDKIGEKEFLNKHQILEMKQSGFDIGSHTFSHPDLKIMGEEAKKREIVDSKSALENLLGFECESFCYPKGSYDASSLALVSEAGYKVACSNRPGANISPARHPFLLRRTEIAGWDTEEDFKKKIAGAYDLMHGVLHWMRGRS